MTNSSAARNRRFKAQKPEHYFCKKAKQRARQVGVPFDLKPEDLIMPTHCPVLGFELLPFDVDRSRSASLDRLKPELGYVKGNVEIISQRANNLKNNATLEELKAIIAWMELRLAV